MTTTDLPTRFATAFERGDVASLASLYADDAVLHHAMFPGGLRGRDAIRQAEEGLFDAFSDITVEVAAVVADGDRLAMQWTVSGTHTAPMPLPDGGALPATHVRVRVPGVEVVHLDDDGLIREAYRYQDVAGFMAQLGLG